MKTGIIKTIFLALGIFTMFSCDQHAIFYTISTETEPQDALINGSPTNMVVFNRKGTDVLYVASGRLHWYAKNSNGSTGWNSADHFTEQPGGRIIALASTIDYLYALCLTGHGVNTALLRLDHDGEKWMMIDSAAGNYPLIQSVYADPESNYLFAGACKNDNNKNEFAILYLDDSPNPVWHDLVADSGMLSAVMLRNNIHYLSTRTRGKGIYQISELDLADNNTAGVKHLTDNSDGANSRDWLFMGMIKLEDNGEEGQDEEEGDDTADPPIEPIPEIHPKPPKPPIIIAIERGGALYEVNNGNFIRMKYMYKDETIGTGKNATGALALWKDPYDPDVKILVAGVQDSALSTSYTHGYVEFEIDSSNSPFIKISNRNELSGMRTVSSHENYSSSLGKYPIIHLFQVPESIDANKTFFASTQTVGLWSYRLRSGKWQWNAEAKNES